MKKRFLIGLAVLTLFRLILATQTALLPEEAYYWTYAQHPSLGYFDHPPMVAWIIKAGTLVCGDTELGVRLITILLAAVTGWLLFLTGRLWFGERVASMAGWLYLLLPVFVGVGFIVTPDAPLLFFWMLTIYAVSRALQSERTGWWLLAGVAFGGALLSKYYGLLLGPSLLVFLVLSKRYRHWLLRPPPWIAVVLALAVFSPPIIWNAQHGWASFAFQSSRTVGQQINVAKEVGSFWGTQLLILTPPGFVLFVWALVRGIRHREDNWSFAVSFAWPLFALFALAAFKTEVHVNWTAPAFLSWMLPAAVLLLESRRWRVTAVITGMLCIVVLLLGHVRMAWGWPGWLRTDRNDGWRAAAQPILTAKAALAKQTGQQPFVLGNDKYNLAAVIGFYTHSPHDCVNTFALGEQGLAYRYWLDLADWRGRPALAVLYTDKDKHLARLREHFEKIDPPVALRVPGRDLVLVNCYGYRPPVTE